MKALALAVWGVALAGCYPPPLALDVRTVLAQIEHDQSHALADGAKKVALPDHPLSEDEAVALALCWNPGLRVARRQRGVAEGEVVAARTLANPTVELQLRHLENFAEQPSWAIELGWQPPQPGVFSAGRAAARAQSVAVDAEIADAEWQLEVSVRAAHAGVVTLGEQLVQVGRALDAQRQIATLVERRMAGGAATRLDLSLAQLAIAQRERERDDLQAQEIAARDELGRWVGLGRPVAATVVLPESTQAPAELASLVDEALSLRRAVVARQMRLLQQEHNLRRERARAWPWFRLTSAPGYRSNGGSQTNPNNVMFGMRFTLPILDQNAGPIQVAEATRDQEREQLRNLVVTVRRELASARDEIALRQRTLRRYRETVLPGLDEYRRMLATATAAGQFELVKVLAAEDIVFRSQREFAAVRLAHYRAWLTLDRAVGRRVASSPER